MGNSSVVAPSPDVTVAGRRTNALLLEASSKIVSWKSLTNPYAPWCWNLYLHLGNLWGQCWNIFHTWSTSEPTLLGAARLKLSFTTATRSLATEVRCFFVPRVNVYEYLILDLLKRELLNIPQVCRRLLVHVQIGASMKKHTYTKKNMSSKYNFHSIWLVVYLPL